jgi:hypothetical protein
LRSLAYLLSHFEQCFTRAFLEAHFGMHGLELSVAHLQESERSEDDDRRNGSGDRYFYERETLPRVFHDITFA